MVVECEGCGTRFNLADGQVPEGGARVRCSKCHHRFVVTPSGAPAADLTAQDSPGSGESAREDPNLDNPEFLFDDEPDASDDEPDVGVADPDGELTQNPDLEQTMIADLPDDDDSMSAAADDDDDEAFFGDDEDDDSVPSMPGPVRATPTQVTATEAMDSAPPPDLADEMGDRSEFGGANELIGEADAPASGAEPAAADGADLDDLGADWDADDSDDDPMSSWDSLLDGDGPTPTAEPARPPVSFEAPSKPRAQALQAEPEAPELPEADDDPHLTTEWVDRVSRIVAIAAGILLAIGGVRAVVHNALGPAPGPEVVRGAGWAAQEISSLQLRDAAGRRIVVVRGSLAAPLERNVPPRVRAVLLDAAGEPVGNPFEGEMQRLSAEQLTPDALSRRLARRGPRGGGGDAEGFTILIPDPPVEARRFELVLEPRG